MKKMKINVNVQDRSMDSRFQTHECNLKFIFWVKTFPVPGAYM